jgi:hypothetical protein
VLIAEPNRYGEEVVDGFRLFDRLAFARRQRTPGVLDWLIIRRRVNWGALRLAPGPDGHGVIMLASCPAAAS